MKQLRLPHGHLSWSGLNLWETDPKEYALKYILKQQQRINSGMLFGSYVADGLENGSADVPLVYLRDALPAYDIPEKKLAATWKGIPLVGRADTFRVRDHAFREYKTGRRDKQGKPPWTAHKARRHGQLAFYGFMLWVLDKKLPPPAYLDWIETQEKNGTVSLTNHIESFKVPITTEMLLDIGSRIERAASEISKQYEKYLNICQQKRPQKK